MGRKIVVKERLASLVMIPEGANVDDVFCKMNSMHRGEAALFDDNGGDPDGRLWMVAENDVDPSVVKTLVWSGDLQSVTGDIVEYDGSGKMRAELDERYPAGWCGYSSRDTAYCWTPEV
jgi:hypothetical protein